MASLTIYYSIEGLPCMLWTITPNYPILKGKVLKKLKVIFLSKIWLSKMQNLKSSTASNRLFHLYFENFQLWKLTPKPLQLGEKHWRKVAQFFFNKNDYLKFEVTCLGKLFFSEFFRVFAGWVRVSDIIHTYSCSA